MTTTAYEVERVHDIQGTSGTFRCSENTCELPHYYSVYQRLGAPGHQAVWMADYETKEEAEEAVETGEFHCCGDECRSNGCTERFK